MKVMSVRGTKEHCFLVQTNHGFVIIFGNLNGMEMQSWRYESQLVEYTEPSVYVGRYRDPTV